MVQGAERQGLQSEFLIAINAEQEEDGKLHIPYLKNKEDKIMQPVFTDVMEFEKFGRGKNLRVAKVTIDTVSYTHLCE